MKLTQSILILFSLFLISNCGDKVREEITERYDNGNMKVVEYYKKVGDTQTLVKKREYYKTGEVEEENYFVNGRLEGSHTEYYRSGQIEEEGTFNDGKLEGKYIHYNKDGSVYRIEEYKDGELIK